MFNMCDCVYFELAIYVGRYLLIRAIFKYDITTITREGEESDHNFYSFYL